MRRGVRRRRAIRASIWGAPGVMQTDVRAPERPPVARLSRSSAAGVCLGLRRDVQQAAGPCRSAANAKTENTAREAARPTPRLSRRPAERMLVRLSAMNGAQGTQRRFF